MKLEEFTKEKKNRNKQVFCAKKPHPVPDVCKPAAAEQLSCIILRFFKEIGSIILFSL